MNMMTRNLRFVSNVLIVTSVLVVCAGCENGFPPASTAIPLEEPTLQRADGQQGQSEPLPAPGEQPNEPQFPSAPSGQQLVVDYLVNRQPVLVVEALSSCQIMPDLDSYVYSPQDAVGAVYQRRLNPSRPDATCECINVGDCIYRRVAPTTELLCEPILVPIPEDDRSVAEVVVRGGAELGLEAVVGQVDASAEYVFEVSNTQLEAAAWPNDICVDSASIAATIGDNVCSVVYVAGVTATAVSWRQYEEITAEGSYNAVIKVDGKLYGSREKNFVRRFLCANLMTVHQLPKDQNGIVMNSTPEDAALIAQRLDSTASFAAMAAENLRLPAQDPDADNLSLFTLLPMLSPTDARVLWEQAAETIAESPVGP